MLGATTLPKQHQEQREVEERLDENGPEPSEAGAYGRCGAGLLSGTATTLTNVPPRLELESSQYRARTSKQFCRTVIRPSQLKHSCTRIRVILEAEATCRLCRASPPLSPTQSRFDAVDSMYY